MNDNRPGLLNLHTMRATVIGGGTGGTGGVASLRVYFNNVASA